MALQSSGSAKKSKKNKKQSSSPRGFFSSIGVKTLLYFVGIPCLLAFIALYAYVILNEADGVTEPSDTSVNGDVSTKQPVPLSTEHTLRTQPIDEIEWSTEVGFIDEVVARGHPVLLRNSPVHSWPVHQWDLAEMAADGLLLNGSRLQSSPVFVLGHDRDKGGMLGKESDLEVSYVNVYLKDFLHSVFDKDTYMYWTGPCALIDQFRNSLQQSDSEGAPETTSFGSWDMLKVVESTVNISRDDESLWTPMLWLSHPGVTAHTHYDTQHNFFAQIFGKKKILIFEQHSELYPYPNIHRSYRQSQVRLENSSFFPRPGVDASPARSAAERFPRSRKLDAIEVTLHPGDLLYIPPYWSHRVESETLAMSVSVLSPSATEVALAEAYWTQVPFGPFESGDSVFRSGAVKMYLYYIVGMGDVLLDLSLASFASDLLHSRYLDLYPLDKLSTMKKESKFRCPSTNDEELRKALEAHAQQFHDAALDVVTVVNDLDVHKTTKDMFYRDYAEQVIRWAVGPENVPLFLRYCLN